MAKFTLKASLLPFIVVIVLLWSMPSASSAATATAFRLPPGNELEALAAAPSGSAFAMVFHPFSISGKVAQGWYVYEVSSAGSVRELPAMIPQSPVGNAGIAAAGPESVWVPTPHSVLLVDSGGIEKSVSVGPDTTSRPREVRMRENDWASWMSSCSSTCSRQSSA